MPTGLLPVVQVRELATRQQRELTELLGTFRGVCTAIHATLLLLADISLELIILAAEKDFIFVALCPLQDAFEICKKIMFSSASTK